MNIYQIGAIQPREPSHEYRDVLKYATSQNLIEKKVITLTEPSYDRLSARESWVCLTHTGISARRRRPAGSGGGRQPPPGKFIIHGWVAAARAPLDISRETK